MGVHDIEYVELLAGDERLALDYYGSYGFAPVAWAGPKSGLADRRSTLLRNGTVQLIVSTPAAPGGQVATFLERHGDGIADVALSCTEEPGPAPVPAFGDVVHRLVRREAGAPRSLPPGRPWVPVEPSPPRPASIKALDHVAVCVRGGTLRQTALRYQTDFGLERYSSEYIAVGDQAMDSIVVRSPSGGITFTLVEPDTTRAPGQLDEYLAANDGLGVQHLAFLVDNIVASIGEISSHGVDFLDTPDQYYQALAARVGDLDGRAAALREVRALADRDEWGYLLQIFASSPHPRRTLFCELIERQAARGFGSANIRALYEAVKRSRATARA